MTETSRNEIARCEVLLTDLKAQERKLMERDYRNEISDELFTEESERIKRERKDSEAIIVRLSIEHDELQSALDLVLDIFAHDIHDLYLRATPTQRRFLNQAIFEAIWISHEDVERTQLTQPFDEIRVVAEARQIVENAARSPQNGRQAATANRTKGQSARPRDGGGRFGP
jgi:hypothetical protein